jgi:hypothetical protein
MDDMFRSSDFNQDIGEWNILKVEYMRNIFYNTGGYNHYDLYNWWKQNPEIVEKNIDPGLLTRKPCNKWIEYDKSQK